MDPSHHTLGVFASQTKFIRRAHAATTPRRGAALTSTLMAFLLDPERMPTPPACAARSPRPPSSGCGANKCVLS